MTDFTRVTVVGAARRADVVVASDEPFAGLLPRFVDILDEPVADSAHPVTLVRVTGEELSLGAGASDQSVADGEVLHLVRRADAPPPPEVSDVTDVVAESLGRRHDTWADAARQSVAAAAVGTASSLLGSLAVIALSARWVLRAAQDQAPSPVVLPAVVLGAALVLALAAVVAGRAGARWTGIVLTAASAGMALPVGLAGAPLMARAADGAAMLAAFVVVWAWIALGIGLGVGQRMRTVGLAAVVGVVLPAVGVVTWLTPAVPAAGWGVVAVASLVACGLLPSAAMSSAGLTGLDDQVGAGGLVGRPRVVSALDDAYRSLDWVTAAVAAPLAMAGAALLGADDPWAIALGVVTVVVTALRTRAFPLALQGVLLWSAVTVAAVVGLMDHAAASPTIVVVVLAGLAVVAALLAGIRPAAHQRARLRSIGNALETIAVVVALPLLLGTFGLFAALLETF
ncbi:MULTISPECIES: EsaB/YukD family protein [unclassified Curtobacterium]|uniref:EsaB/YukD family protein n=1 Tax=unclassified Curtobacterium TaxID=257496 RepID=UPI0037F185FC